MRKITANLPYLAGEFFQEIRSGFFGDLRQPAHQMKGNVPDLVSLLEVTDHVDPEVARHFRIGEGTVKNSFILEIFMKDEGFQPELTLSDPSNIRETAGAAPRTPAAAPAPSPQPPPP